MSNNEITKRQKLNFPQKLWKLVNDDSNNVLKWSTDGTSLCINFTLLEDLISHQKNILNLSKRSTFLSLLTQHNFQKKCRIVENGCEDSIFEFKNVYFQRDRIDLLDKIEKSKNGAEGGLNCDPCKRKIISNGISRLTWARQHLRLTLAMQHLVKNKDFYVEIENLRQTQDPNNSVAMFYENPMDSVKAFVESGRKLGYVDENSCSGLQKFYENFSGAENIHGTNEIVENEQPLPLDITAQAVQQILNEPESCYRENIIFTIQTFPEELSVPKESDIVDSNLVYDINYAHTSTDYSSNYANSDPTVQPDIINPSDYFTFPDNSVFPSPLDISNYDSNNNSSSSNMEINGNSIENQDIYFTEPSNVQNSTNVSNNNEIFEVKDITDTYNFEQFESFPINEMAQYQINYIESINEPELPPDYYEPNINSHDDEAFANFFFEIRESLDLLNE